MKNEMKLIMENWRRSTAEFDPIYVENILGIKMPLVERKYRISESLREEILIQENFIKNFFKGVKDGFFDKLGALGGVMRTLFQVITDPSKIKTYVTSIMKTKIIPYRSALKKLKEKLSSLNMPTFASAVNKILKDIEKISNEAQPVRKALSLTSMVLLLEWVNGLITDQVDEIKEGLLGLPTSIEKLKEASLNLIKNIIMKKLPAFMVKLFGAITASVAAFPAWVLTAVKLIKGATWVGETLKNTLSSFKMRTDRESNKKKAQSAGTQAIGPSGQINIAKRDDS
jgi:hypothetical protein